MKTFRVISTLFALLLTISLSRTSFAASNAKLLVLQQPCAGSLSRGCVEIYSLTATGTDAPLATLNLALGGNVQALAVDPIGRMYVADINNNKVYMYAANSQGDDNPVAVLSTGVNRPFGVAVDASNNIYVANNSGNDITVYAANPTGNEAPLRIMTKGVGSPGALAIFQGYIYAIPDWGTRKISIYPTDVTNPSPIVSLSLAAYPRGIALDHGGRMYVEETEADNIQVFLRGSSGNVASLQTITGISSPVSPGIDPATGKVYVGSYGGKSVVTYGKNACGNLVPLSALSLYGNAESVKIGPWTAQ